MGFYVEKKRMGAGLCCQPEICDKRADMRIYIMRAHVHRILIQRKMDHSPHHFIDVLHYACPLLPEQITVSRELPVHRLGSRTQIGSARISDHCNLVFLFLSPVIRNISQHNENTGIVLSYINT